MKIVGLGSSGFIGRHLLPRLQEAGHEVVAIVRRPGSLSVREILLDGDGLDAEITHADAIINLAGESIADGRWSGERKQRILDSRLGMVRRIAKALDSSQGTLPHIWINASAVGYYGDSGERELLEDAPLGTGFLSRVCEAWENEVAKSAPSGVAPVLLRFGLILGSDGGALPRMALPFRYGFGGPLGSGNQYMPWIHVNDAVAAIEFLLAGGMDGPVNICAPRAVTSRVFARTLGAIMHRPSLLSTPAVALRFALGEMSEMMLGSQNVVPHRLLCAGFRFSYPELQSCLQDLVPRLP